MAKVLRKGEDPPKETKSFKKKAKSVELDVRSLKKRKEMLCPVALEECKRLTDLHGQRDLWRSLKVLRDLTWSCRLFHQ